MNSPNFAGYLETPSENCPGFYIEMGNGMAPPVVKSIPKVEMGNGMAPPVVKSIPKVEMGNGMAPPVVKSISKLRRTSTCISDQ